MKNYNLEDYDKLVMANINFKDNVQECFRMFSEANDIVISTHQNPDGDAIGSALALYHYGVLKGKNVEIIIHSDVPFNLDFFNGADKIRVYKEERDKQIILDADLIAVVDLNDSKRLKSVQEPVLESKAKKFVIDHHMEPKVYSDLYAVDTDASSAGELIYKFIALDKDFEINKDIADALYAAIMTDTGSFRFPRTDAEVHRIIAHLIETGADPVYIYEKIYNQMPENTMRLLGIAFAGMEFYADGRFCLMSIAKEVFAQTNSHEDDVEGIVENGLHVKGVEISVLITEIPSRKEFRMSFRSKGNISVRETAIKFNGGGHKHAAGARIESGELADVKAALVKEVEALLGK